MSTNTLSTLPARSVQLDDVELIDVRSPAEYRSVHAVGARNIPLANLDPQAVWSQKHPSKKLVLICKSGQRATLAANQFASAGLTDVSIVEGGTDAWAREGLPVVRGKAALPIERQVLIGAGLFVLVGLVLALFVNPWFLGLTAFVGFGLIVAGSTGFCGMALVLGHCPWNK